MGPPDPVVSACTTNGLIDGWTQGWIDGWMIEWRDGWTMVSVCVTFGNRQMDGWTDGWTDRWTDGWTLDARFCDELC